jgi:hypothetical protein
MIKQSGANTIFIKRGKKKEITETTPLLHLFTIKQSFSSVLSLFEYCRWIRIKNDQHFSPRVEGQEILFASKTPEILSHHKIILKKKFPRSKIIKCLDNYALNYYFDFPLYSTS